MSKFSLFCWGGNPLQSKVEGQLVDLIMQGRRGGHRLQS